MRVVAALVFLVAFQSDWRSDRELAMDLRANGVMRERPHAVVYYESGALADGAMDEFADLVERGTVDISKSTGAPQQDRKISFFVSPKIDISRARGRSIYLPLERVKTRTAPYLHETTHILVPCEHCPTWLAEGYASYLQCYVAEHMGGYDGQIFTRDGNRGVDGDARRWLSNDRGKAMLPYVGTELEEPDLSDRRNVAAPFYVLSQSLVKYLVETTGTKELAALGRLTNLSDLRAKWLAGLQQ